MSRDPGRAAGAGRELPAAAAARGERTLAFLSDLVAIPTENPPGRMYRECVDRIAAELAPLRARTRVVEVPAPAAGTTAGPAAGATRGLPRYCLLSELGRGDPAFYLHGHYDVVPATAPGQFAPLLAGGRLYGRGAADMKSGLAAMVHALGALRDCGLPRRGRVVLVAVPDEETGGGLGAEWLGRSGLLEGAGAGAIVGEPTSGRVWLGHRGALSLRLTVRGRGAHGILQHEGVNAFEQMLRVAREFQALKTEVEARETRLPIEPAQARRSILMLGGECSSGHTFNTVPAAASFSLDRRTNPEEDFAAEKARLLDLCAQLRAEGVDLETEILQEAEPTLTDVGCDLARALAEAVAEITGRPPALTLCPGLLETRFYARRGMPALAYGPGLLEVAHSPREYVDTGEVAAAAAVYAVVAARLLG